MKQIKLNLTNCLHFSKLIFRNKKQLISNVPKINLPMKIIVIIEEIFLKFCLHFLHQSNIKTEWTTEIISPPRISKNGAISNKDLSCQVAQHSMSISQQKIAQKVKFLTGNTKGWCYQQFFFNSCQLE